MQTIKITTSQNIDIDYPVANIGDRILARLIDGCIFLGILLVGMFAIGSNINSSSNETFMVIIVIVGSIIVIFYDLVCEIFFNGQSVGKRVMKIKVISLDGASPTVSQYLLRWIFRLVDFTLTSQLGAVISVAASEKKQRIGDIVAGTTLIKTTPKTNLDHLAFRPVEEEYQPVFAQASQLTDAEIVIIHEVLSNFMKSGNYSLLHSTAVKIKEHLAIIDGKKLNDEQFLRTIIKDYNHSFSSADS